MLESSLLKQVFPKNTKEEYLIRSAAMTLDISQEPQILESCKTVELDSPATALDTTEESNLLQENELFGMDKGQKFPDGGRKAYTVVLGANLGLMATFAIMNSMGVVESYIMSHQLAELPTSTVGWVFGVYTFMTYAGGIVGGPIFDALGVKYPLVAGAILQCGGIFATANAKTVWQFVLGYGVMAGLGTALLMPSVIGVVSHWFLKRRGLALGMAQMGGSAGGIVFPLMFRSLFPKIGYAWSMRVFAFISVVLLLCCFLLVRDRNDEINEKFSGKSVWERVKASIDFSGFKDPRYRWLTCSLFFNEFSLMINYTYLPSYATSRGFSDSTGYLTLVALNAAGMIGRSIPAHFSDRIGRFNTITVAALMIAISNWAIWLPFGSNIYGLYVFCGIFGASAATTLSLTAICTGQISRVEDFGKRFGTAYFFVAFGNLIVLPIGGAIIGNGSRNGYNHMVLFACCMSTLTFVCFLATRFTVSRGLIV
ncbi:unnamed protein product [Kuraishia capsulata CBS 1993]|uniref:Major facilitator superfamily (MFS) profile domain-containing protein n=1 Tax=Kuraishia capsulata CBS 1993 TaxID=1382522 RepID=W6MVJ3_9ASCO|nr:uncharacterized protein KUCA_T00002301001 [Kuraishia capsulata CBS 1993]CDK26330.1 unnamed protein product [Kuraishia capsulata CBS 1993]